MLDVVRHECELVLQCSACNQQVERLYGDPLAGKLDPEPAKFLGCNEVEVEHLHVLQELRDQIAAPNRTACRVCPGIEFRGDQRRDEQLSCVLLKAMKESAIVFQVRRADVCVQKEAHEACR